MANRREVIQAAVAATALPFVAKLSSARAAGRMRFHAIVYDERFEAGVAFARRLQYPGSDIQAIAGDITDLWYGDLYYRWRDEPVPIAGLTTHDSLFCLERLAWDHGLRLTYLAEHRQRSGGMAEHRLSGPQSLSMDIEALRYSGGKWPESVADLISRDPLAVSKPIPNIFVGNSGTSFVDSAQSDQKSLFTWVLAPIKRA